ncbi:MAG: leucine-rich repeat domain-containing protein [Clostridia bacterium]|nr:leucine-rich repeat domain-containing protein [Clostridia bacterium]
MKKLKFLLITIATIACVFALGILSSQAATYGDLTYSVSSGKVTITDCNESATGALVVPDKIEGYPVTAIGNEAFRDCTGITKVEIGNNVTTIGNLAFYNCSNIRFATLPNSLTSIGNNAFYGCSRLVVVDYNGNETEYIAIIIGTGNDELNNAEKTYFAYVTIFDQKGNVISKYEQYLGGYVYVDNVPVKKGTEIKLYTDQSLTTEFALDTPVTENLELYTRIEEHTATTVSNDGRTFTVTGYALDRGNTVIVALYEGGRFVEMQSKAYESAELTFTTTKDYDTVKVMVWESLGDLQPVTKPEIIDLATDGINWASDPLVITSKYTKTNNGVQGIQITGIVGYDEVTFFAPTAETGAAEVYAVAADVTTISKGTNLGTASVLLPGDVIQYKLNSKGEAETIIRIQDAKTMDRYVDSMNFAVSDVKFGSVDVAGKEYAYYLGYVSEARNSSIAIQKDMTADSYDERTSFASNFAANTTVVRTNFPTGTRVATGDWGDIWADSGLSWGDPGYDGYFVLIKTEDGVITDVVVYQYE